MTQAAQEGVRSADTPLGKYVIDYLTEVHHESNEYLKVSGQHAEFIEEMSASANEVHLQLLSQGTGEIEARELAKADVNQLIIERLKGL